MGTARFGAGGRPAATAIGRPKSTAAAAAPGSPAAPAAAAAAAAAVPDVPGSVRVAHPWADMVCAPSLRTTGEISVYYYVLIFFIVNSGLDFSFFLHSHVLGI